MLDLTLRLEKTIARFVQELPDSRGRVTLNADEDGVAHLKGATDTRGYWACGKDGCKKAYPCKQHGPHGKPKKTKGRRIDPHNVAYGYSKQDVSDLRTELQRLGITITKEEAEACLLQAKSQGRSMLPTMKTPEEKRAYRRDLMRRRREEKRAQGFCIICTSKVAGFDEDGNQRSTCRDCSQKVADSRARKSEAQA